MNNNTGDTSVTLASTTGGVLLVLINIRSEELAKTAILAGLGAVVSFVVTMVMKWLYNRMRKG